MLRPILPLFLVCALLACSSESGDSPAVVSDSGATTDSGSNETSTTNPPEDSGGTVEAGPTAPSLDGYWVWKEIVEGGSVTRTITDDDMAWKVGPTGWPGCPAGISCTKYGIDVLYVNATRFHHMNRVTTGSDYQNYGSYTAAGGVITLAQAQAYSCAHPKNPSEYPKPATLYARFKKMGEDLWITPFGDKDPGEAATKWTVYRAISKTDAHGKYDHPFCGEMREGGECHCLCPSPDVLADYTCAKP